MRDKYRLDFVNFIIHHIRDRYSCQLGIHFANEPWIGKDMKNGATIPMKRDAVDYGIHARTLLIKISCLLIKYNIDLTGDENTNVNLLTKHSDICQLVN